jgi:hypothetical protein
MTISCGGYQILHREGKLLGRKFSFTIAVLFGNLFNKTAMKKQGTFFQILFSSPNFLFLGMSD